MNKSVLWTAAGVVMAIALWGALSLPTQHSTPVRKTIATPLLTTSPRLIQDTYQVRILDQGICLLSYLGSEPPRDLTWDGKKLTITAGNLHVSKTQTSPTAELSVNIEYSFRKSRAHSSSSGICFSPRILKPGTTVPIRI